MESVQRYYRIGEVARLLKEQPHTLRYWERQFQRPCPRRGASGERLYSEEDIAILRRIQHVLRVQRCTVHQAKQILGGSAEHSSTLSPAVAAVLRETLELMLFFLKLLGNASQG